METLSAEVNTLLEYGEYTLRQLLPGETKLIIWRCEGLSDLFSHNPCTGIHLLQKTVWHNGANNVWEV